MEVMNVLETNVYYDTPTGTCMVQNYMVTILYGLPKDPYRVYTLM